MLSMYPAIFYEEKEGGYSVIFPDLNHLATCGDTLEDAMAMAVDCLANYLYIKKMEGNAVPSPTPLEKVAIHCEESGGWEKLRLTDVANTEPLLRIIQSIPSPKAGADHLMDLADAQKMREELEKECRRATTYESKIKRLGKSSTGRRRRN